MRPDETAQTLERWGVVPVVVVSDAKTAEGMCHALTAGGMPWAEITLRTPAGLEAIRIASAIDGFSAGAGTVLTARQAEEAIEAGANFIVSPGLSKAVVAVAMAAGIPVIPGAVTSTEIMAAADLGLELVKFFPAGQAGGPAGLRALAEPFGNMRFMPTGGVSPNNLDDYLSIPAVAAVGGSWITPASLLAAGQFAEIEARARTARATVTSRSPKCHR